MPFQILFQQGNKETAGENGLYVEEAIEQIIERIRDLDKVEYSQENEWAIDNLEKAISWLNVRSLRKQKEKEQAQ